jgi:hypothetical protein
MSSHDKHNVDFHALIQDKKSQYRGPGSGSRVRRWMEDAVIQALGRHRRGSPGLALAALS